MEEFGREVLNNFLIEFIISNTFLKHVFWYKAFLFTTLAFDSLCSKGRCYNYFRITFLFSFQGFVFTSLAAFTIVPKAFPSINVPNIDLHKNCGNQTNREWCGLPPTACSSVSSLSLNDEKWQFSPAASYTFHYFLSLLHRLWLANYVSPTEL